MDKKEASNTSELISFSDTVKLICRSRPWIYNRLRTDPTFPKPIQISPHSVLFRRSELIDWINSLPRAQLDGLSAVERRQAA